MVLLDETTDQTIGSYQLSGRDGYYEVCKHMGRVHRGGERCGVGNSVQSCTNSNRGVWGVKNKHLYQELGKKRKEKT